MPTVQIGGQPYTLSRLTKTSYLRLAILVRPTDGTALTDMVLDSPDTIADPQRRAQATADRHKAALILTERLSDDITTRRLAFALKSVCPQLVEDNLVVYRHLIRPDDWIDADFDVFLEPEAVLDLVAAASNWLTARSQQTALGKAEALAAQTDAALSKGFQTTPTARPKPQRRRA